MSFSYHGRSLKASQKREIVSRRAKFEPLESRDLLALSVTTADYQVLVDHSSFGDDEASAIWVTSLSDVTNVNDGRITLREAIDYANQSLSSGETVTSKIRFTIGGTINLSSSLQSLKVLSKSVTIDASDVGGVTIQGKNSLLLYVFGGTSILPVSVSLKGITLTGGKTTSYNAKGSAVQLNQYCELTATQCSIVNNASSSGLGTGIYVDSGSLTLIDSTISNNESLGEDSKGGAIYVNSGSVIASRTFFSGNTSATGGVVYVKSGSSAFYDCYFSFNTASSGDGGAIYSTGSSVVVDNASFQNNSSSNSGGAIYLEGTGIASLTSVKFSNNKASNGGAIYQDVESLTMEEAYFNENTATQNGGAIYVCLNAYSQIISGNFHKNAANLNGGAIFNEGSLFVTDGEFDSNEVQQSGGAIYSSYYFEIRDTRFTNNVAQDKGGALFLTDGITSWLLRTTIDSSSASEGAGVYNKGKLTIADSTFVNNSAKENGGAFVNLGDVYITETQFLDNLALGLHGAGGGGLNYPNAKLTIVNSQFSSNIALLGDGGALANNGTLSLSAVTFDKNRAEEFGGGIYNGGDMNTYCITVSNNEAQSGGGLATTYGSTSQIISSTLWGNIADDNGGALYTYGKVSFEYTTIAYNVAASAASAAYYYSEESTNTPKFDSASSIYNNVATSDVKHSEENSEIVLIEADNYTVVTDGIYFDNQAVLDAAVSKSFLIKNIGKKVVKFSDLSELTNAESSILSFSLVSSEGEVLNPQEEFMIVSNDYLVLTITSSPQKVGSKYFELTWTTDSVGEDETVTDNLKQTFTLNGSLKITKSGTASTSVSKLSDSSANISVNENGSFSISLSKAPVENTVVYLKTSNNATLSTDVLLFTSTNYSTPQTVTVTLSEDYIREHGSSLDSVIISPQVLSTDSSWFGSTLARVQLKIQQGITFIGSNKINLNDYAPAGTTEWDIDGDGESEVTTSSNSQVILDMSDITSKLIGAYELQDGESTLIDSYEISYVPESPSACGEVITFASIPGMAKISMESSDSVIKRWRIDWGDGTQLSSSNELGIKQNFTHVYQQDGEYAISVELVDLNDIGYGTWSKVCTLSISGITQSTNAILEVIDEIDATVPDFQEDLKYETTLIDHTTICAIAYGPSLQTYFANQSVNKKRSHLTEPD